MCFWCPLVENPCSEMHLRVKCINGDMYGSWGRRKIQSYLKHCCTTYTFSDGKEPISKHLEAFSAASLVHSINGPRAWFEGTENSHYAEVKQVCIWLVSGWGSTRYTALNTMDDQKDINQLTASCK